MSYIYLNQIKLPKKWYISGLVSHVSACHSADSKLVPLSTPAAIVHWAWRFHITKLIHMEKKYSTFIESLKVSLTNQIISIEKYFYELSFHFSECSY